jgi:N utilization substance protein B
MNNRSNAREVAFKLTFEYLFNREINTILASELLEEYKITTEKDYVYQVYNGIDQHFDELSKVIEDNSIGFSIGRIYKVDYAILLVALFEIRYMPNVPYKVSINEALNLAKQYSTIKSKSFINGILAKVEKP